jgi:non-ribosomal peptide synthetase component F
MCSMTLSTLSLDGWGNRAALSEPAPVRRSIPEVFAEQVAATPEATAITFAGQSLTYAEVDAASNRLAHYLVDRGVGPGRCVGCCCRAPPTRSWPSWRCSSGAAYVPIDPAHPG